MYCDIDDPIIAGRMCGASFRLQAERYVCSIPCIDLMGNHCGDDTVGGRSFPANSDGREQRFCKDHSNESMASGMITH